MENVNYRYVLLNPMISELVKELTRWSGVFEEYSTQLRPSRLYSHSRRP